MPTRIALRKKLTHPVSLLGLLLAITGLFASASTLLIDLFQEHVQPYRGILTFLVFPAVLFLGLFLTLLGLLLEQRRARRLAQADEPWRPVIDLNRAGHRRGLLATGLATGLFVLASIVGASRAYEFTESVQFCGEACHQPMEPQYTAYQDSPHASVSCSRCHVGPGLEHYIDAKVSGLRQVYQLFADSYPRPIRAPREKIIPANETCEGCHWPDKSWGQVLDNRVRFGYDLQNTRRPLQMVLKVGGSNPGEGIHWHMHIQNQIWYRTLDERHLVIPWVKVERPDGTVTEYREAESPLGEKELAALPVHRMDCLGCHNRPAHRFQTADEAVDRALETGALDRSLPFIKKAVVEALVMNGRGVSQSAEGIREAILEFYRERFEGKVLERGDAIEKAIEEAGALHRRNVFPSMNVGWNTYPDHIGHREFPGCFRCHNGKHRSDDGKVLDSDCSLCHRFYEKDLVSGSLIEVPAEGTSFHPFKHPDHYSKVPCWSCHTGVSSPYAGCGECHEDARPAAGTAAAMHFECSICHKPATVAVTSKACVTCHPAGGSAMHAHRDHGDCVGCHAPHRWKADPKASCFPCHDALPKDHYPDKPCSPCHDFRGVQAHMMGLPATGK